MPPVVPEPAAVCAAGCFCCLAAVLWVLFGIGGTDRKRTPTDIEKIRVLPDGMANQIAAGEAVGRPASVVKELLEMPSMLEAASATVNFGRRGRALIQVVDNGCGMNEPDARMALERHATSKIASVEDLLTPAFVRFSRRGASVDRFGGRGASCVRVPLRRKWARG
ncbi:MAG: hypothetical protein ACLTZY_13480 [Alistipes indistinctus]